ncbi:MAG: P-loop NTPase fold protein [Cyclobacteriaceae bacterium]
MDSYLISIDSQKSLFYKEITKVGNRRIIFSGAFGTGKTTFLKKFFFNSDQYISIHLYPINYSVSKNEDIFELVKFDILYELLDKIEVFQKMDVKFVEGLFFLNNREQAKALEQFLTLIPKIGKPAIDVLKSVKSLFDVISERRKKSEIDELKQAEEFIKKIENTEGSIYEIDLYSQLLINLIIRLKEESKKEVILVVDDLDRIDPDHIFRILNVLAAHVDHQDADKNKFNFDKIILSCDVDNIRKLFHNKFGQDVNFSGYIDKFYSRGVYRFNNNEEIAKAVNDILLSIKVENESIAYNYVKNTQSDEFQYIKYILISFVNSNAINLRTLIKLYGRDYELNIYHFSFGGNHLSNNQISSILVFDFLLQFFGDMVSLLATLDRAQFLYWTMNEFGIGHDAIVNLWNDMILLADINSNKLKIGDRANTTRYKLSIDSRDIAYNIEVIDQKRKRISVSQDSQNNIKNNPLTVEESRELMKMALASYLSLEKRR